MADAVIVFVQQVDGNVRIVACAGCSTDAAAVLVRAVRAASVDPVEALRSE